MAAAKLSACLLNWALSGLCCSVLSPVVHLECSGVQCNGNLVKKKVHYIYFQNKFYKSSILRIGQLRDNLITISAERSPHDMPAHKQRMSTYRIFWVVLNDILYLSIRAIIDVCSSIVSWKPREYCGANWSELKRERKEILSVLLWSSVQIFHLKSHLCITQRMREVSCSSHRLIVLRISR